jgi:hypothetical protein
MAVVQQDWLVRNSQRKYPLDDTATAVGDAGSMLPDDFLVDMNVWVPRYEYSAGVELTYIYVSSAALTPKLATLTLLGSSSPAVAKDGTITTDGESSFVPLGFVTVQRPVTPFRNYAITAALTGVRGWVAFGPAVLRDGAISMVFSGPRQGMVAPRAVRHYDKSPVESIGPSYGVTQLTGDVKFAGASVLSVSVESVIDKTSDEEIQALVFNLDNDLATLEQFAGPCVQSPAVGTCPRTPIQEINGVRPNSGGYLNIEFEGDGLIRKDIDDGETLGSDKLIDETCAEPPVFDENQTYDSFRSDYEMSLSDIETPGQTSEGYWWFDTDASVVYGVPLESGVSFGPPIPCHPGASVAAKRTFSFSYTTPAAAAAGTIGLKLMAYGARYVLVTASGTYKCHVGGGIEESIGAGGPLDSVAIVWYNGATYLIVNEAADTMVVFESGDPWWQPQGYCRVYVEADPEEDPAGVSSLISISSITAADVLEL